MEGALLFRRKGTARSTTTYGYLHKPLQQTASTAMPLEPNHVACPVKTFTTSWLVAALLVATMGAGRASTAERAFGFFDSVDLIFLVDNSGGMSTEIPALEAELIPFVIGLTLAGLDYRVILVTRHGDSALESVCVPVPLSGLSSCESPVANEPVNNPPIFYHYSVEVGSHNALCEFLTAWSAPDEHNLAPSGINLWSRAGAFQHFIVVSDDGIACGGFSDSNTLEGGQQVAADFETSLLALSTAHFGTLGDRNYAFHSLVGADQAGVIGPDAEVTANDCPTAVDPGTGYQSLSRSTGGLRFSSCATDDYDTFFEAVADFVLQSVGGIFMDGFESGMTAAWN